VTLVRSDRVSSRLLSRVPLAGVALAIGLVGCGSSSSGSASKTPVSSGPPHVVMSALEFNPGAIHAKVGQTITWTNKDTAKHNVTYVSGPRFKSSATLPPRHSFSLRLTQAGTIHYVCTLHPWMKATIVVSS
jgi:plastocyanin